MTGPLLLPPGVSSGCWHGTAVWDIQAQGARARVSAFGGQLLDWRPVADDPVFWLSPCPAPLPAPIRGGVPLCWPWFARQGQPADAPAHGLARTACWRLQSARVLDDGRIGLVLVPRQALQPGLELQQVIRIGRVLEQELHTRNTGDAPVILGQALHSYFRVPGLASVGVEGLAGCRYEDAVHPGRPGVQQGSWHWNRRHDGGRVDRIHAHAGQALRLVRGQHLPALRITPARAGSLVLWTPGEELGMRMADVGAGWNHYLCLEVANAGEGRIELAPGQAHRLGQQLALD